MPKRLPFVWNEANKERFDRVAKRIETAMNTNAVCMAPDVHVQPVIRENVKSMADLKSFETIANALEREGSLKVHKNKWGVEYTDAGRVIQRAQIAIINRKRRARAKLLAVDIPSSKRKRGSAFREEDFNPLSEQQKELMPKKLYTKYKYKRNYKSSVEAIARMANFDYYDKRDALYRENYLKSLEASGFSQEFINKISSIIMNMSPTDFYMYASRYSDLISVGYNYNSVEIALKAETIIDAWNSIVGGA